MTRGPIAIQPGTPPEDAIALMHRSDLRHLPLCAEDGRLLGLVGLGELLSSAPRGTPGSA